ncbi:hypothetical protein PVAND_002148 [Polypedilum vanderplanki]|uniref:Protein FAM60A n=1 Tax=Polypedilum vanderplanki TaxID=319348 RepID=A0A9J6BQJ8_POLVA|nr:hypothetical protein PVAND_002148 [Polypedilum vanderplanki]
MFSFHKPKVYRSTAGCCICKAKSSSSRFTDSKKYETDFIQCFQLDSPRKGEICNACVLLVKRFKRLPPGSNRHWGHVVDARTGPGLKSMTKFKKRKEEQEGKEVYTSKIFKKSKKKAFKKDTSSLGGSSDDSPPSPTESQHSDFDDDGIFEKKLLFSYSTRAQKQNNLKRQEAALKSKRKRKNPNPIKVSRWPANFFNLFSDVVSDELWHQKITCCGAIYECKGVEAVMINVSSFKPCKQHASSRSKNSNEIVSSSSSINSIQQMPKISEMPPQISSTQQQHTPTAIKKHHLFLKRNSDPSVTKSCDTTSSSTNVTEFSNINDKTELMDTTDERKDNMQSIDIKFKINDNKNVINKMEDENAYEQIEANGKLLLQEINHHAEVVKIIKPALQQPLQHPLSSVNGDKMSMLKYKLASMARFGGLGNDNSSDSGYEEVVQDGTKQLIPQMPPPQADVLQSL